mgnify:FL=1
MKKKKKKDKELSVVERATIQKIENHMESNNIGLTQESVTRQKILSIYLKLLEDGLSVPTQLEVARVANLSPPTVARHLKTLSEHLSNDEVFLAPLKSLLLNRILTLALDSDKPCIKALRLSSELILGEKNQAQQFNQQVIYHVSGEDDDD